MLDADQLLPHMRRVQVAERDLCDLGALWQMIETSAAISCPDEVAPLMPTLVDTRERFDAMRQRLVERMVEENRATLGDELGARAQCAIDILVRNLYERTADVGFLATDAPVCAFCAAGDTQRGAQREALRTRLHEYQAKYTVYDDIALLSPAGEVLLRLDDAAGPVRSTDPLLARALAAPAWVEAHGPTDLAPAGTAALRYAHRVVDPEGQPVGVLVLRFRFDDEMARIFAGVADELGQAALVLLDDQQRVIVSNDEAHVPRGARLPAVPLRSVALTHFAGREYLAVCCASQGYQGYAGPPWRALAMVSLLTAFSHERGDTGRARPRPLASGELAAVERDADAINRELRRVVWNGRLMTGHGDEGRTRLKAVLRQVSQAGVRTRRRLEQAIVDLSATSLARTGGQARQLARLAADIMDRNLYERANDCRWWALSPVLRHALAAPDGEAARRTINAVLDHVNGLYTVYSRLVVFDLQGAIRGASRADGADGLLGSAVPDGWVRAVAALQGSQRYAVSDFGPTALHDAGDTYVYLAAVRADTGAQAPAGGIAIVFNAARELAAMLADVLGERPGFAAFVDRSGRVLAATDAALARQIRIGHADGSGLVEADGVLWACAASPARGYREFKHSDGYDNGVHAVVGLRIGTTAQQALRHDDRELAPASRTRGTALEAAVFRVGHGLYALGSDAVLEVVPARRVVRAPGHAPEVIGLLPLQGGPAGEGQAVPVLCAHRLMDMPPPTGDAVVLLLRAPGADASAVYGLRVDDVLTVLEVPQGDLHPAPRGMARHAEWLSDLIDCRATHAHGEERTLIQLMDADHLARVAGRQGIQRCAQGAA